MLDCLTSNNEKRIQNHRIELHHPSSEKQPALRVDVVTISDSTDTVNNRVTWEQKSLLKSQQKYLWAQSNCGEHPKLPLAWISDVSCDHGTQQSGYFHLYLLLLQRSIFNEKEVATYVNDTKWLCFILSEGGWADLRAAVTALICFKHLPKIQQPFMRWIISSYFMC